MAGYKLGTYQSHRGPRAALIVDDRVYDAAELTGKAEYATVLGVLADWTHAQDALATAKPTTAVTSHSIAHATLQAPVLWPSAIFCAGANYADHIAEMSARNNRSPDPDPRRLGLESWHFIKAPRTISHPGATVSISGYSQQVAWEAELAAVIGHPAKNVSIADALRHVAGYTIANDLSARDRSRRPHLSDTSSFKLDWVAHKCFDGSCPLGPWIVPAGDIPDPQNLGIKLWVNDVIKQDSNTSRMIFTLAEQISHLSARMTLHPGDLILTGTPAGVGSSRGEFLKAHDVVKIWIENIGEITTTMS